jgi:hypothetical protein
MSCQPTRLGEWGEVPSRFYSSLSGAAAAPLFDRSRWTTP